MEKFKVTLTVEERKRWNTWSPSARPPHASWPTPRILLLADEGPGGPRRSDEDMVEALGQSLDHRPGPQAVRDRELRGRPRPSAPTPATGEGEAHRLHREAIDPIGL